jgi:hypothetical protein
VLSSYRRAAGQGLAEYALILSMIMLMAVFALMFMGGQLTSLISWIGGNF